MHKDDIAAIEQYKKGLMSLIDLCQQIYVSGRCDGSNDYIDDDLTCGEEE